MLRQVFETSIYSGRAHERSKIITCNTSYYIIIAEDIIKSNLYRLCYMPTALKKKYGQSFGKTFSGKSFCYKAANVYVRKRLVMDSVIGL